MILSLLLFGLLRISPTLSGTTSAPTCVDKVTGTTKTDKCYSYCDSDGISQAVDVNDALSGKTSAEELRVACESFNSGLSDCELSDMRAADTYSADATCQCPICVEKCDYTTKYDISSDRATCTLYTCTEADVADSNGNYRRTITIDAARGTDECTAKREVPDDRTITDTNKDTSCSTPCDTTVRDERLCVLDTTLSTRRTYDCEAAVRCAELENAYDDGRLQRETFSPCILPDENECATLDEVTWDTDSKRLRDDPIGCPLSCRCVATDAGNRKVCDTNTRQYDYILSYCRTDGATSGSGVAEALSKCQSIDDLMFNGGCPTSCDDLSCRDSATYDSTLSRSTFGTDVCRRNHWKFDTTTSVEPVDATMDTCRYCACDSTGTYVCDTFTNNIDYIRIAGDLETCTGDVTVKACGEYPECVVANCEKDRLRSNGDCLTPSTDDTENGGDTRDRMVITTSLDWCADRLNSLTMEEAKNSVRDIASRYLDSCDGIDRTNWNVYCDDWSYLTTGDYIKVPDSECDRYVLVDATIVATTDSRDALKVFRDCIDADSDADRDVKIGEAVTESEQVYRDRDTSGTQTIESISVTCCKRTTTAVPKDSDGNTLDLDEDTDISLSPTTSDDTEDDFASGSNKYTIGVVFVTLFISFLV